MSDIINLHERLKNVEEMLSKIVSDLYSKQEDDSKTTETESKSKLNTGVRKKTAD